MFKTIALLLVLAVVISAASAQYIVGAGYYPSTYSTYGGAYYGYPGYGYASYGVPAVYYKK